MTTSPRLTLCAAVALAIVIGVPSSALAGPFHRTLSLGDRGSDVRALKVRVAGWYDSSDRTRVVLNRRFGSRTKQAVKAFQSHYGLTPDGIAGPATFRVLDGLQDPDGSTAHFDWSEFEQNRSSYCGAQANAYAGTFRGGPASSRYVRRMVHRLMWRLEALRAKAGNHAIGINSGFRSIPYNRCIGGASSSQHLYGDAADNRMSDTTNRRERNLAKGSDFSGIGCYSDRTHNHFDLRLDNPKLAFARFWWWPAKDRLGRDLDDVTRLPCWGQTTTLARSAGSASSASTTRAVLQAIREGTPEAGSVVPDRREITAFERAGERPLNGHD